ncbi:MAG: hypothetical protein R3C99_04700 [Pirellulaceae bacterium]|nr:hypothetical protein [Planctomycetales bacterium]MCA9165594.1 hypothetical protein [Planctomycetales bacterium]MCA9204895.1 hypothetical protein [Planctomycetales bacterium]MCA9224550.1 hypothetical protein [Planctomycetales bacterium]
MSSAPENASTAPEHTSAQQEHQHHHYTGNSIPWYVRLIWIGFWVFTVYYTIRFLFPALQVELLSVQ